MLLMALLALTLASAAQDENTGESPEDNACYAGGSLDGKCDWPTDAEDEWAWTCGWYIARVESGVIPEHDIPKGCSYSTVSVCYDSSEPSLPDLQIIGPPDRLNNAQFHMTFDGSCTQAFFTFTVVSVPQVVNDFDLVVEKCAALIGHQEVVPMPLGVVSLYHGLPADYWGCITVDSFSRAPRLAAQ
jgi:hypothetical protein